MVISKDSPECLQSFCLKTQLHKKILDAIQVPSTKLNSLKRDFVFQPSDLAWISHSRGNSSLNTDANTLAMMQMTAMLSSCISSGNHVHIHVFLTQLLLLCSVLLLCSIGELPVSFAGILMNSTFCLQLWLCNIKNIFLKIK